MKIRLQQMHVAPGRPADNLATALAALAAAEASGIHILVLPEMCLPGYLLGDEWERASFLRECEAAGRELAGAARTVTVVFGNVGLDWQARGEDGRARRFNALFVAERGEFLAHPATGQDFFSKFLLPNYREFDDNRYFYDPRKLAYELKRPWEDLIEPVPSRHGLLGCMLCEDGWDQDYNIQPAAILARKGAEVLLNLSASPFTFNKNHKRNRVFAAHAKAAGVPLGYVNKVGLQDNGKTLFTFDGASAVYAASGALVASLPAYTAAPLDFSVPGCNALAPQAFREDGAREQYEAIAFGTGEFMQRLGVKKVVVGVSGGIDSAVVAALYAQLLPPGALHLVSMPGPFTSNTTLNLARQLAQNLDCPYAEIPIGPAADLTRTQLSEARFASTRGTGALQVSDYVFENIQARDRSARVLAGVAAALGGVFTCNANKSEMTVGYSTLYGDLGGYLANIADLWKGEVYELARYLNAEVFGREAIPQGTLDVVPSAELSGAQNVDENRGDPLYYPYHDCLFQSWVERWDRATPEDNLAWYSAGELPTRIGYAGDPATLFPTAADFIADLERWWNLYQGMAIAKRIQAPPVLAIKRRAFGFDHREAQLGPRYSRRYQELKQHVLSSSM